MAFVTIPANVHPGMQFTVCVEGQRFMVTCPNNKGPMMKMHVVPPARTEPMTRVFQVIVPAGVRPNQPFTLNMIDGQRVLVTCPANVAPGQKMRFQLPVQQVGQWEDSIQI